MFTMGVGLDDTEERITRRRLPRDRRERKMALHEASSILSVPDSSAMITVCRFTARRERSNTIAQETA